jgi:predicted Zn-ribbon and HTH transcriptional regulator
MAMFKYHAIDPMNMPNNHCYKCHHDWIGPMPLSCPKCKSHGWYESPSNGGESYGLGGGTCDLCGYEFVTELLRDKYCPNCGSKKWDDGKPQPKMRSPNIWVMEKVKSTKKGSKTYTYWMATWREDGKTRNVHLGSCGKMGADEARQKAMKMKAEAFGIKS